MGTRLIQQLPKVSAGEKRPALLSAQDELVERLAGSYRAWLTTQTQQHRHSMDAEMQEYAERASQAVEVKDRRIQTFAPFRYKYSALQTVTRKQVSFIIIITLLWMVALLWNWRVALVSTVSFITMGYLAHLFLDGLLAIESTRHNAEERIDETVIAALDDADWPPYTVLCPLYKEAQIIPQFVKAMKDMDYPADKLQILFLTEADDQETRRAIYVLHLPPHFKVVTVPDGSPRTKPRACNYGLIEATGQYVVIFDAEDVPDPLQLKKAVLTFANHGPDLACVQAKLNFYNPQQNILTRWFTAEYSLWFDLILPGLQKMKLALPLGGTSNHFPVQTLRALGGWDAFNVTEDCDLGLRLSWFRLNTVIVNSTTLEEANSRLKNWIRQRSRWIKGYMQTYLVHMREPLHYFRSRRYREFISLQVVVGGKTAFLLLNPLMWLFFLVALILGKPFMQAYTALFPPLILYIGFFTLVLGNFFYGYSYLLGCMKREQYALVKWMLLIPLYWIMASAAAYMALYELCTRPHYWQKTIHGLHLNRPSEGAAMTDLAQDELEWESLAQMAERLSPVISGEGLFLTHGQGPENFLHRYEKLEAVPVPSVQDSVATMIAPRRPALLPSERILLAQTMRKKRDPWLHWTLLTASLLSVATFVLLHNIQALSYITSAVIHTSSSFRFDITGAGKGNLWLPLPQLVNAAFSALFSWNGTLREWGVGGNIPSMLCYILASLYIFLFIRLLSGRSLPAYLGALVFMLNPMILYLQSAPVNELMAIALLCMTCYYLLAWTRSTQPGSLIQMAACICLATLCRYDFWILFAGLLLLVPAIGFLKGQRHAQVVSNLLVFGILGGLGMCAWFTWCWSLTGSPLYFLNGSKTLVTIAAQTRAFLPDHNFWQLLQFAGQAAIDVAGPLVVLALAGGIVFLAKRGRSTDLLVLLVMLLPFVVTLISLYVSQYSFEASALVSSSVQARLFWLRLGAELVAPAAILAASLFAELPGFLRYGERV